LEGSPRLISALCLWIHVPGPAAYITLNCTSLETAQGCNMLRLWGLTASDLQESVFHKQNCSVTGEGTAYSLALQCCTAASCCTSLIIPMLFAISRATLC
jgi:hypothetical protein